MSNPLGIDLSDQNGAFNWASLRSDISFIACKATEGITFQDQTLPGYLSNIKTAGLKAGVYHFWIPNDDPQQQADNYFKYATDSGFDFSAQGSFCPIVDVENGSTDAWVENNQEQAIQNLKDFISAVQTLTGRADFMIYSYHGYWVPTFGDPHDFSGYYLWRATGNSTMTPFGGWTQDLIYQYKQNGSATSDTAAGDVDCDFFNGTTDQLNTLANIPPAA